MLQLSIIKTFEGMTLLHFFLSFKYFQENPETQDFEQVFTNFNQASNSPNPALSEPKRGLKKLKLNFKDF